MTYSTSLRLDRFPPVVLPPFFPWQGVVVLTTSKLMSVYDAVSLDMQDTGYKDNVDTRPFLSCDVSPDGMVLVAASSSSNTGNGNIFFFTRHQPASMHLKVCG
jgi:hypothetical protein